MGPLAWVCCLAVLTCIAEGRPSAEVSERDARGQTISDSSDPFWVFRSSEKPTLYGPAVDPLLPAQGALISLLPSSSPRRRRPILAILDLLQKRYSLQQSQDGAGSFESGSEDTETKNTTPSTLATEEAEVDSDQNKKGTKPKPNLRPNENITRDSAGSSSLPNIHLEKVPQVSKIYALLDTLMKNHPDPSDGFSYAFKYRVPQAPTKMDDVEVSVQQSIKRFPELSDDALLNRHFKTQFDYAQVQSKLDTILEDSANKGTPLHLNTPGAFGPLLLNQYLEEHPGEEKKKGAEVPVTETSSHVQESRRQKPTKLILRPVAKAVAGPRGIAVASPLARAVLRRGQKVTLEYEPDAVAIAGPGGRAHAHPEFSVDYMESKEEE